MDIFNFDIEPDVKELLDKSLPDPSLLDYYNRLSRREIFINDEIDDRCVEYAKQIMEWNAFDKNIADEDKIPIKIFINSGGGDTYSAWSLIDAMMLSKTPVITIGVGCIYSAASMIFIAGHKRYILPHSTYMIHDGYTSNSDSIAKMIDDMEFTKLSEKRVKKYYIERTKISADLLESKYRTNWWMFPEDMIRYGIADSILTDLSEI